MGSYAIAYADKNGNGFSNDEPWIEAGFEKDLELCKRRAIEMVKHGLKKLQYLSLVRNYVTLIHGTI